MTLRPSGIDILFVSYKKISCPAARIYTAALAHPDPADPFDRARALVTRAELAIALGDRRHAIRLRAELETLPLSETDRERLGDELLIRE